jgi:hypothetical protein
VTPYAVLANLAAEPLLVALLPISALYLACAVAAQVCSALVPVAAALGTAALWLLASLWHVVQWFAHRPGALLAVRVPDWCWILGTALWCLGPTGWRTVRRRRAAMRQSGGK